MKINFDQLSSEARIWPFISSRAFSVNDASIIHNVLDDFLDHWESHGAPLTASFTIMDNQIIVVGVESNAAASGCSIDKLTHTIIHLEKELSMALLNRLLVAYRQQNQLKVTELSIFKTLLKNGELLTNDLVCNPQITTKSELETFEQPIGQSWAKKWLTTSNV